MVPRQDQSGNSDRRGHITKHGPSMLRFVLVTAAHSVIKYSQKLKKKYLSIVKRLGKNRAIVAIARLLIEIMYAMLTRGEDFVDEMESLTERKMRAMSARARNPKGVQEVRDAIDSLRNRRSRKMSG